MSEQDENRARLRKALEEKGVNRPPATSPFSPMRQRPPGVPEFFARGVGEAARHTGNAVGSVFRSVNDWHVNRGREMIALDDARKRMEAEYLPQIREANRNQQRASNAVLGRWAPEKQFVERAERGNQYVSSRLDDARYGGFASPFSGSAPPDQMSDEDLMAELEALNGMGGPR